MSFTLARGGRRVAAVDPSAAMIARARRRYGLAVDFIEADAEDLPFDDDAFDAVVNLISFHHYPDPLRALVEFRRVLRRDGRLVLIAFDRRSRYIELAQRMNAWTWQKTPAEICALLSATGFTRIEVSPVHYFQDLRHRRRVGRPRPGRPSPAPPPSPAPMSPSARAGSGILRGLLSYRRLGKQARQTGSH
jgi:SAM-dependent methyltransferase